MRFLNWKNQYIDAVETKPDFIISADGGEFRPEALQALREKMCRFNQIYCEIGSGSGAFLIENAKRESEVLFCGFELRFKRAFRTAEKAELEGLSNLLVVRGDALQMDKILGPRRASGIYINFPDPWNKKKWKKHRMISTENIASFSALLEDGGFLRLKTDHKSYFHDALSLFQQSPLFDLEWQTEDLWKSEMADSNIPTEFELLFRSKGLPVYALKAIKAAPQAKISPCSP